MLFCRPSGFFFYPNGGKTMKKQKKKRKGFQAGSMRCPYCGSPVIYRSADGIYHDNSKKTMLYVCSHYPECDAYVRVHAGTNIPVGSLANHELRTLRRTSRPTPKNLRARIPSIRSSVFTRPPLDVLTRTTPSFIFAMVSLLIRW